MYRQTSNINRNWVGNKRVDHTDVVGAAPVVCRRCSSYIFILDLPPDFNGFDKGENRLSFGICDASYIRDFTVLGRWFWVMA